MNVIRDGEKLLCEKCGAEVIQADINSPGISGTEYLTAHQTFLQVIDGYRRDAFGTFVAQTKNVWGYNRHLCF